jgi:hypothetical protein
MSTPTSGMYMPLLLPRTGSASSRCRMNGAQRRRAQSWKAHQVKAFTLERQSVGPIADVAPEREQLGHVSMNWTPVAKMAPALELVTVD